MVSETQRTDDTNKSEAIIPAKIVKLLGLNPL